MQADLPIAPFAVVEVWANSPGHWFDVQETALVGEILWELLAAGSGQKVQEMELLCLRCRRFQTDGRKAAS